MARQVGMFDIKERLSGLTKNGDDLERLAGVVDFELFRPELERAVPRADRAKDGRPLFDHVVIFKVLILQTQNNLNDMRFLGLGLSDPVPDANTIWTFREALTKAGASTTCSSWSTGSCTRPAISRHVRATRPMPSRTARANAKKSARRARIEHVFAEQKARMGLFVRTIGLARATTKIGLAKPAPQHAPPALAGTSAGDLLTAGGDPNAISPSGTGGNRPSPSFQKPARPQSPQKSR